MKRKVAVFAALALAAGTTAAQPKEYKPPTHQVAPALDRIAMTEFVCDPATIPPGATQVTLKVTVKNLTGGPQAETLNGLKLRILRTTPQPDVLELETTVVNLAAGATQSVSQRVNVARGTRAYFARVDVDDTLHEPLVQRANNEKRLTITVPPPPGEGAPPPPPPAKETQLLDYEKAKRNGARFAIGAEGASLCSERQMDVNDANYVAAAGYMPKPPAGVLFNLNCEGLSGGGRMTPEAFTGFLLKNGWKVKSFDIVGVEKTGSADWQWRKTPSVGSDDPSMRMHLWAENGGKVRASIKVTIEGPAGTNPYQ